MTPDHEHVNLLMRIWLEVKSTPPDILIGFTAMVTVLAKLLGRSMRKQSEYDPPVKLSQMNQCKEDIIKHVDERSDHLEERIDDLYKGNGK